MAHPKKFVFEFNYCSCKGCDKLLKTVEGIEGVQSIRIDESERELTVFGIVKPETVIETIKKNSQKYVKFLREEEESPPEIKHKEMQIVVQQNRIRTFRDQRKVAPLLPDQFSEPVAKPVDIPVGNKSHDCTKDGHEFELKVYNKPFKCNGCREDGFTSGYRCKHCVYDLHMDCKSPKPEVTHDFFKGSKFKFRQEPGNICAACGMKIHGHSYSCKEDNLNLHPACSKLPLCIPDTDFELSNNVKYKCFFCNLKEPSWSKETAVKGLCFVSKEYKISCHVHCISGVTQEAWKRGDLDCNDGDHDNGVSKTLKNVDRKPVVNVKPSGGKGGSLFLKVVTILLKTVIGILFGDPTGLIVSVFVGLSKEMLSL